MTAAIIPLAIVAATPLILAVIGELLLERAGVINIGLEGMMLCGALTAVLFAQLSRSAAIGILGGIAGSLLIGALFGLFAIRLAADQIVTGTALNFVALGLTSLIYRELNHDNLFISGVPAIGKWSATYFADTPVVGPLLFHYDPVTVIAWVVIPIAASLLLWRTRFGLRLRATGEYPLALPSNGIAVAPYQWAALAIESVLCGIAGAFLSLGLSSGFAENMVAGRGFIALAIVVFGRWTLRGSLAGVAIFGVTAALQYWLQASFPGFPFQVLLALPYIVTILALAMLSRTVTPPEWLGKRVEEE